MNNTKILYVDDEEFNLMLFEANLDYKYNILTALEGYSGLELLSKNNDIKIVISDMKMPKMNGVEFIKNARNLLPHIIFYIISGFDITDEIQELLDNGFIKKYFKKPFNTKELSFEFELALNEMNN
jgi:response regulator RpfG family c-di-GMP phosphodiesterase